MTTLYLDHLTTPVGKLYIITNEETLYGLGFPEHEAKARQKLEHQLGDVHWTQDKSPLGATAVLQAYFDGDLQALIHLPVAPQGTNFQQRVWTALCEIPVSTTTSYGALAVRIGSPTASRAVGLANGRNPIAIVIPCHRVIGANATLTGYAGGLERKQWLLTHEQYYQPAI